MTRLSRNTGWLWCTLLDSIEQYSRAKIPFSFLTMDLSNASPLTLSEQMRPPLPLLEPVSTPAGVVSLNAGINLLLTFFHTLLLQGVALMPGVWSGWLSISLGEIHPKIWSPSFRAQGRTELFAVVPGNLHESWKQLLEGAGLSDSWKSGSICCGFFQMTPANILLRWSWGLLSIPTRYQRGRLIPHENNSVSLFISVARGLRSPQPTTSPSPVPLRFLLSWLPPFTFSPGSNSSQPPPAGSPIYYLPPSLLTPPLRGWADSDPPWRLESSTPASAVLASLEFQLTCLPAILWGDLRPSTAIVVHAVPSTSAPVFMPFLDWLIPTPPAVQAESLDSSSVHTPCPSLQSPTWQFSSSVFTTRTPSARPPPQSCRKSS